jgi:hypothetical protein
VADFSELSLTGEMVSAAFPVNPADDPLAMQLLPDDVLDALLETTLAARPSSQQECWIFAYGSLM